jgi:hypothetical protein
MPRVTGETKMKGIALSPKDDVQGLEERVLLAECRSPSSSSYSLADAKNCMQLMDRVLLE